MNKKFFSILLSIIMLVVLSSGISTTSFATDDAATEQNFDDVNAVVEKIDAIGDVTIHSGSKIKEARTAYDELDDSQKALVENFSILTEAEIEMMEVYEEVSNTDHASVFEATGMYIEELGTPDVGSVGGEWMVISLTRSGRDCPDGYYENVVNYISENINDSEQLHRAKSTDNSRVILALTSAGYDVTNVDGHNLLSGLSDMSYLKKQGINGPIWALIAFDSYAYEIPTNENEQTQATREEIISYILEKQLPDGGWSLFGNVADPDMTGMAIQALAPYYHTNSDVEVAVEKALNCLSNIQYENGGFGSVDGICSESCAQVIVALTALGINPETDEQFVKNGVSVVDALCIFAVDGGGLEHISNGGLNGMATEQGQYALVSYFRLLEGESFLYDMTDVTIRTDDDSEDDFVEDSEEYYVEDSEDGFVEDLEEYYVEDSEDGFVEDLEEYYVEDSEDGFVEDFVSTESGDSVEAENDKVEKEENKDEIENTEKITFTEDTFADVKKDDWHYESVKYVFENTLMQGTENGFEPESKMTRAMLVTVLYRMARPEASENTHSFTDVASGQWYSDAVAWAAENNIVSGVSENKFAPDEDITREQMSLIIYRFAKMQGFDVSDASNLENFIDIKDVSDWALQAIKWANKTKLVNGTSENTLSPKDTATRAQVATILMRFCETIAKEVIMFEAM